MTERLIVERTSSECDVDFLSDALTVVAANIENSLLENNAKPNVDYTYTDLYQLAMKYVLAKESKLGNNFLYGMNPSMD